MKAASAGAAMVGSKRPPQEAPLRPLQQYRARWTSSGAGPGRAEPGLKSQARERL